MCTYLYVTDLPFAFSCLAAAQEKDAAFVPKFTATASLQSSTMIIPV